MGLIIRAVTTEDFEILMDIEHDSFKGDGYSPYFVKMIPYLYPDTCFIAEWEGLPAGYGFGAIDGLDHDTGWLMTIAVKHDYRSKGIGKALTLKVIETLENLKLNKIVLTVSPNNPARNLYKRIGFQDYKFEKDCYGKGEDRYYMERIIKK